MAAATVIMAAQERLNKMSAPASAPEPAEMNIHRLVKLKSKGSIVAQVATNEVMDCSSPP